MISRAIRRRASNCLARAEGDSLEVAVRRETPAKRGSSSANLTSRSTAPAAIRSRSSARMTTSSARSVDSEDRRRVYAEPTTGSSSRYLRHADRRAAVPSPGPADDGRHRGPQHDRHEQLPHDPRRRRPELFAEDLIWLTRLRTTVGSTTASAQTRILHDVHDACRTLCATAKSTHATARGVKRVRRVLTRSERLGSVHPRRCSRGLRAEQARAPALARAHRPRRTRRRTSRGARVHVAVAAKTRTGRPEAARSRNVDARRQLLDGERRTPGCPWT